MNCYSLAKQNLKNQDFLMNLILLISMCQFSLLRFLLSFPMFLITSQKSQYFAFILLTIDSPYLSTFILALILHLKLNRPLYEYLLIQLSKALLTNLTTEVLFTQIILFTFLILNLNNSDSLNSIKLKLKKSTEEYKKICDSIEIAVLVINESGKILKFNKKSEELFEGLKDKNLFDLIPDQKVERLKNMIKIANFKKFPEEDSTYFFKHSIQNFWVALQMINFNSRNSYFISLRCSNLSRKKRNTVIKSYQKSFKLQEKIYIHFIQRCLKHKRISLKDYCLLIRYMYMQQETIAITEMITGESICSYHNFDYIQEFSYCINLYKYILDDLYISLIFHKENTIFTIETDKFKHHLLIKSLIHTFSHLIKPSSTLEISISHTLFQNEATITYNFLFQPVNKSFSEFYNLFNRENDIDFISAIINKYDIPASLLPWISQILNCKVVFSENPPNLTLTFSCSKGDPQKYEKTKILESFLEKDPEISTESKELIFLPQTHEKPSASTDISSKELYPIWSDSEDIYLD